MRSVNMAGRYCAWCQRAVVPVEEGIGCGAWIVTLFIHAMFAIFTLGISIPFSIIAMMGQGGKQVCPYCGRDDGLVRTGWF